MHLVVCFAGHQPPSYPCILLCALQGINHHRIHASCCCALQGINHHRVHASCCCALQGIMYLLVLAHDGDKVAGMKLEVVGECGYCGPFVILC